MIIQSLQLLPVTIFMMIMSDVKVYFGMRDYNSDFTPNQCLIIHFIYIPNFLCIRPDIVNHNDIRIAMKTPETPMCSRD